MKGVDISQHNGKIDFNKVKNEVDFVILRLGWIGNKNNHTRKTISALNFTLKDSQTTPKTLFAVEECLIS